MSNGPGRTIKLAKDGLVQSRSSGAGKITRVFIDVDTQRDFMYPHGADYLRQAGHIAPRLARLFRQARCRGHLVVSTTMCLRGRDCDPNDSCVEGTDGQKKPAFTLLARRAKFGTNGNTDLPVTLLRRAQQVIFEKRGPNPFEHPKFDRLLTELKAREYVVFGIATEEAIKHTVLGLLARGKQVKLVIDATACRDPRQGDMALKQMMAKGARLITAHELAPRMKPRPNLEALAERFGCSSGQQAMRRLATRLARAALKPGGNGNGKGNGNGNGKKSKKHGGNGNGIKTAKIALVRLGGNGKKSKVEPGGNGHNGKKTIAPDAVASAENVCRVT